MPKSAPIGLATLPFQKSASAGRANVVEAVRELFQHRELLGLLVRRELKSATRTAASFLWSLIRPLTMLLIYYVAIGQFLGAHAASPTSRSSSSRASRSGACTPRS